MVIEISEGLGEEPGVGVSPFGFRVHVRETSFFYVFWQNGQVTLTKMIVTGLTGPEIPLKFSSLEIEL